MVEQIYNQDHCLINLVEVKKPNASLFWALANRWIEINSYGNFKKSLFSNCRGLIWIIEIRLFSLFISFCLWT